VRGKVAAVMCSGVWVAGKAVWRGMGCGQGVAHSEKRTGMGLVVQNWSPAQRIYTHVCRWCFWQVGVQVVQRVGKVSAEAGNSCQKNIHNSIC